MYLDSNVKLYAHEIRLNRHGCCAVDGNHFVRFGVVFRTRGDLEDVVVCHDCLFPHFLPVLLPLLVNAQPLISWIVRGGRASDCVLDVRRWKWRH